MKLRKVTGPFASRQSAGGSWRLTAGVPEAPTTIFLRTTAHDADRLLSGADWATVTVEWRAGSVTLTLGGLRGVERLTAQTAIIHEPRAALYERLPLAVYDSRAARFWRRVFWLLKVPGGRFLLKYIARRNR